MAEPEPGILDKQAYQTPRLIRVALFLLIGSLAIAAQQNTQQNLVDLHKKAGSMSNAECLACHGAILKGKTANPKVKTFHRLHLQSKKETPKDCSDCHSSVDLREGSAGALRKQVDPNVCAGCHDGSTPGIKKLFR